MPKRSFRLSDSRPDAKRDVDDEMAFHLEMRTREFIEQGFPPDEARRKAMATFGDVQAIRTELREERTGRNEERARRDWWSGVRMDVQYAIRSLRKNPGFAIASIATLALGIGATLAVFTVVNGVLLRPLPYKDPSRIAMIWITMAERDGGWTDSRLPLTSGFYSDIARDATSFESMAAFRSWGYSLGGSGAAEAEPVAGARVTPALFDVLGVHPFIGQSFTTSDAVPGGPRVTVLSHSLWQRRFGGDPSIVGKQITLSGESFTVLGIMPVGFTFPRGAELPAAFQFPLRTEVWTPLVFDSTDLQNYGTMNLSAVGRPKPNVSLENAQADLSRVMRGFLQRAGSPVKLDYRLVTLSDQAARTVKRGLLILLGAVFFLLVIACANVASLLVARASGRQRELAVRAAIGAGRGRIARQLVTENLVLASAGTVLGIALSYWGTKLMLALVPGSMPRADDIGVDWRVLLFAAITALVAGGLFGFATAFSVRWTQLTSALHAGDSRSTGTRRLGRQLLVASEVALSVVLLIGAALLTRSFIQLQQVQPGFDASNVLTAGIGLPIAGKFNPTQDGPRWTRTFNAVTARLATAPGVVAAGAVSSLPLTGAFESGGIRLMDRPAPPPGQNLSQQYNVVSGNYFAAARIRLIAGRVFDSSDDAPGAASMIVSRAFARKHWPQEMDAIGKQVMPFFMFTSGIPHTIVGIVDNVKQMGLDDEPAPQVYVPVSQMPYPGFALVIRTKGDPLAAVPMMKRELRAVDPTISINDVRTMEDVLDHSLARQRFSMTLIAVFATSALVLAIVGLYGVIALVVGQRRREIGVRLALGARPADVVRMVVAQGSRLGVAGVVLGLLAAFALTRVLRSLLYDVSATDAATFIGAALVVLLVSVAAGIAPARRAAKVDPTVALRAE